MRHIYTKAALLFILSFILVTPIKTRAQGWVWAKTSTCNNTRTLEDLGLIAIDKVSSLPGIYIVCNNQGDTICLSTYTIPSLRDSLQTFIAKYDTAGNVLWAIGSKNGQCAPMNLTTDASGNLLFYGCLYTDSVSFGSHTIINPNYIFGGGLQKNQCYIVIKFDIHGNVIWSTCGGNVYGFGTTGVVMGGITVDNADNVYVSGMFGDSSIHIGSHVFVNTHVDSGDIFIIKYDNLGNFIWGKTFGNVGNDYGGRILIGKNNRLYMTGWFTSSSLTLGGTTLMHTGMMSSGAWRPDAFVAEFDTSGNPIWAKCSVGNSYSQGFILDDSDNIYMSGGISDTSFSFGSYSFSNPNLFWGGYILKFDTLGNTIWGKSFYPLTNHTSGSYGIPIYEIAVDPCNNVWFTGTIGHDSAGVNGSVFIHTPPTGPDPLLFFGYSSSGSLLQCLTMASGGDDNAGMVSDCNGNIYIAGDLTTTLVFGTNTIPHVTGSSETMFLAKYNPNLGCSAICGSSIPESQINPMRNFQVVIYPNPTPTELTITSPDKITRLTITNLLGQPVFSHKYNTETVQVNVAGLPNGIYLLKINGCEVRRFVKE